MKYFDQLGELLTVSEINAELVSVTNRYVTLKDAEGIWSLPLGDSLRDRKLIDPAPKPADATPAPAAEPPATRGAPAELPADTISQPPSPNSTSPR